MLTPLQTATERGKSLLQKKKKKNTAGVAVFPDDISVAIEWRNVEALGKKEAETSRVEVSAGTEHAFAEGINSEYSFNRRYRDNPESFQVT